MDDLITELSRLQAYATGLGTILSEAQAKAPPSAEGADRSGAVRAQVGPDGFPVWVRVAADWQHRLDPAVFGPAVTEACAAAAGERMSGWTRALADGDWQARVERLAAGRTTPPAGATPPPGAAGDGSGTIAPRPPELLADSMLKAFEGIGERAGDSPPAASATGSAASGRLVITLSEMGTVSCTAEAGWVSAQSATGLTDALDQALSAARRGLATASQAARQRRDAHTAHLDGLLSEALALLRDPRLLTGPGEEQPS